MPNPNSPSDEFDPNEVDALLASLQGAGAEGDKPPIDENGQAVIDGKPTNAHKDAKGNVVPGDGDRPTPEEDAQTRAASLYDNQKRQPLLGEFDKLPLADLRVSDVVGGAVAGVSNAVVNTVNAVRTSGVAGGETDQFGLATGKKLPAFDTMAGPQATAGRLAESVAQFGVGMIGATKVTALRGVAGGLVNGFIAGGTVFDPHQERLSNLVEQHPSLANPITAYLAADPKDSAAEGRLKSALENGLVGGVADGLLNGLKAIKKVAIVRATEGDAAALKVAQEEVQSLTKKAQTVDEGRMALGKGEEGVYAQPTSATAAAAEPVKATGKVLPTAPGIPEEHAWVDMTGEQLSEMAGKLKQHDDALVEAVFGEKLRGRKLEAAIDDLPIDSPEYKALHASHDPKEVEELARLVKGMESVETPDEIGSYLGNRIYKVISAAEKSPTEWLPSERDAVALYRAAQRRVAEMGWDPDVISKEIGAAAERYGHKPADIAELFASHQRAMAEKAQAVAAEASAPALPAPEGPKSEAEIAPSAPAQDSVGIPKADKAPAITTSDDVKDYLVDRIREELKNSVPISSNSDHFNLSKMTGGVDVINIINRGAEAIAPEMEKLKGGVQTFEDIKKLADAMELKPEEALEALAQDAATANLRAARLVFAKRYVQGLAKQISEYGRRLDQGVTGDKTPMKNLIDQMTTIIGHGKAAQTGYSRATAAGRILNDPVMIRALVAADGDMVQVAKILNPKSLAARVMDAHNEFWINALLSGVKTQEVNFLSTGFNTMVRPAVRALGGTLSGDIGSVKEAFAHYMGMSRAIWDSLAIAKKSLLLEDSFLVPNANPVDAARFAISNEALGVKAGFDWMGKAVRLPSRFLTAADEFWKQINYRSDLYARASRQGVEMGLTGDQLAKHIDEAFEKGLSEAGGGLDEASLQYARKTTFTNELGGFGKWVQEGMAKFPVLRLITPFVRTPTNLLKQTLEHTPLALLSKNVRADIVAGGVRRADAVGRLAFGGMALGGATILAANGRISGRGPKDKAARDALLATGWQPYSVKFGNTWVSFARIEPYGSLLGLVADVADTAGHVDDETHLQMALGLMVAVANDLTSKTYMKGLADFLDVLNTNDEKKWENFAQQRVTSYVGHPRQLLSLLTAGRTDDNTMRDVRGWVDSIMEQVPGFSSRLPPKRDFFGNPVHYPVGTGPDSLSPIAVSKDVHDSVKEEFARLATKFGKEFELPSKNLSRNIDLTRYVNKSGQTAYDRMLELRSSIKAGRFTLKERLEDKIQSDQYKNLPDGTSAYPDSGKVFEIHQILGKYQHKIIEQLCKEYPDLGKDYKADLTNSRVIKSKGAAGLKSFIVNQR
jgi:hypothetical protein